MANTILTLVSKQAIKPHLDEIDNALSARSFNIIDRKRLNPLFNANQAPDAYALEISSSASNPDLKGLNQMLSSAFSMDAIAQDKHRAQMSKKLACFDMDSTLIQHEVMDELAYRHGIGDQIAQITESAMRGEISFKQSFDQRLACLKGFDASLIPDIAQSLQLTPGAETLIKTLKYNGVKVAILSGGFENFAIHLQTQLGEIDEIYANKLEIDGGKLTGKITNELVSETRKLKLINQLAEKTNCSIEQTLAVGDGANDIPMILQAGLGIAYHAKPVVQQKAINCVNHNDLSAILYALGYAHSSWVNI